MVILTRHEPGDNSGAIDFINRRSVPEEVIDA